MSQQELEQEYQRLWVENQQLKAALAFRNALLEERARVICVLTEAIESLSKTIGGNIRAEAQRMTNLAGLRK